MAHQQANIDWTDGPEGTQVPISTRFDDPYFSLGDGLSETRHVFLFGNDLPARFAPDFTIAELGFGTGLNFLATVQEWSDANVAGRLHYTSFEAFPMTAKEMARALAAFPELADLTTILVSAWASGKRRFELVDGVTLEVVPGDARTTLPAWNGTAQAWFLDGFSPAKNPELWGESLMNEVAGHTAPGGTFATYTAAGFVRRSLSEAGFSVARVPGYGRKRHMTRGCLV